MSTAKRFKAEYHHCKVTVNAIGIGKIQIDVDDSDANQWANVKEFAFMIEDDVDELAPIVVNKGLIADSYEDFTLNELRERFPDIKATSKKAFIEQIQ
jgi:hypothetical protein